MNTFFRIDEGRWATAMGIPVNMQDGLPNPLGLPRPLPFSEIESKITDVEKIIYTRRSTRVFKKDPVPKELIKRVLEAGRFAPTAGNCMGVKFVVITDRGIMTEISRDTIDFLGPKVQLFFKKNPVIDQIKKLVCLLFPNGTDLRPTTAVAGTVKPQFGDGGPVDLFFGAPCTIMVIPHKLHVSDPEVGIGIICHSMVLAAHALGLGTCYVGLQTNMMKNDRKNKGKYAKRLGLEWPYDTPAMFLLLGYPAVPTADRAVPRDFPPVEWIG